MARHICTVCGYDGEGKKVLRGSSKMEWAIWVLLMFPGPLYSLWRRVRLKRMCPHCQMQTMVSVNTDEGWLTQQKFDLMLEANEGTVKKETVQVSEPISMQEAFEKMVQEKEQGKDE